MSRSMTTQQPWPWPETMDALLAAPASHRVLLNNDRVRVLEVVIEPGAREPEHTRQAASLMIVDEPAQIRYYMGGTLRFESQKRSGTLPRHEDDEAAEEGIGRILALSDGVFAIAITLLILEIAVPAMTGDSGLPRALLGLWPRYLAYALSFLVIARFWVSHRLAFRGLAFRTVPRPIRTGVVELA
jgi:Endosomal/lysosomal potassium channel TMEM175